MIKALEILHLPYVLCNQYVQIGHLIIYKHLSFSLDGWSTGWLCFLLISVKCSEAKTLHVILFYRRTAEYDSLSKHWYWKFLVLLYSYSRFKNRGLDSGHQRIDKIKGHVDKKICIKKLILNQFICWNSNLNQLESNLIIVFIIRHQTAIPNILIYKLTVWVKHVGMVIPMNCSAALTVELGTHQTYRRYSVVQDPDQYQDSNVQDQDRNRDSIVQRPRPRQRLGHPR